MVLLPVIAAACAQVRELGGGDKDEVAPRLLSAEPAPLTTDFTGTRIVLRFDERIQLDRVRDRMLVSPPLAAAPEVRITGANNVTIDLKAPLRANTTYTFGIGEAVKDLTEANIAAGLSYVISTGPTVDSLSFSGTVSNAFSGAPEKDVLVVAYATDDTSTFRTGRPTYATRANTSGAFQLRHLRDGDYRIYALRDQNADYTYDLPNEEIAFLDRPLRPTTVTDTTVAPIALRLFREPSSMQQVREAKVTADGALRVVFARPETTVSVRDVTRTGGTLSWSQEWGVGRDTVLLWPSDTTDLVRGRYELRTDSILDTLRYRPVERMPFFTDVRTAVREDGDAVALHLITSRPLRAVDSTRFRVVRDSTELPFTVVQDTTDRRRAIVRTTLPPGASAMLMVMPKGIEDIYGGHNDTLQAGLGRAAENSTGTLRITVKADSTVSGPWILQLLDMQGNSLRETRMVRNGVPVVWERLAPGNHGLRLIADANGNGRWDPGLLDTGLQPERVWRHAEVVNVRAAWDLGVEWELE